jgi:hypothetical protein
VTHAPQHDDDDDDAQDFDPEGPDPAEMDYSDDPDLEVCPNCRKMISEEAERCPQCGEYLIPSQTPMPLWGWIIIVLVIVATLLLALLGR